MKSQSIRAAVSVDSRDVSADFHPSTGRLVVREGTAVVEAFLPPDSWMALAVVNASSGWGTQPTQSDLHAFLRRYLAIPGIKCTESSLI